MLLVACTGFGEALLVTVSCAPAVAPTTVLTEAELFNEFGSNVEELAVAVLVMTVPFATPLFTFATSVKVAAVRPCIWTLVQTTLPKLPTGGAAHVHPEGTVIETNAMLPGIEVTMVALSAALGPLLVTICV